MKQTSVCLIRKTGEVTPTNWEYDVIYGWNLDPGMFDGIPLWVTIDAQNQKTYIRPLKVNDLFENIVDLDVVIGRREMLIDTLKKLQDYNVYYMVDFEDDGEDD